MRACASRRQLLGGTGAPLLLAAPAAGAAKAAELDADLLAACSAFEEADRQVEAGNHMPDAVLETDEGWEQYVNVPGRAWQAALEALCDCPAPRTPEAVQCKAQAALMALRRFHAELVPGEITLALSALEDVAGVAA